MKSQAEQKYLDLLRQPVKTKEEVLEMNKFADLFEKELSKESEDLTRELNDAGIQCKDVWDLVRVKTPYPNAIDVLVSHLRRPYHDKNKEGIIRALTVKEGKSKAGPALIAEYENTPKEKNNLRWVIGNAIATTMTLKEVEWMYATVLDKTNGTSRSSLVLGLGTVRTERSEDILISLLDDHDVAPQVLAALGMLKSKKSKDKILQMRETTKDSLIRLEATKALKKIG